MLVNPLNAEVLLTHSFLTCSTFPTHWHCLTGQGIISQPVRQVELYFDVLVNPLGPSGIWHQWTMASLIQVKACYRSVQSQTITWANVDLLAIDLFRNKFQLNLIKIQIFLAKNMYLKMLSAALQPFMFRSQYDSPFRVQHNTVLPDREALTHWSLGDVTNFRSDLDNFQTHFEGLISWLLAVKLISVECPFSGLGDGSTLV